MIRATNITPAAVVTVTHTRSTSTRGTDGVIQVRHERVTETTPAPVKPSDQHSDFWRLDFSSPAMSGYLTL